MKVGRSIDGYRVALSVVVLWTVFNVRAVPEKQSLNILDVQRAVFLTHVLSNAADGADVNGDGRVDILDLQYLVSRGFSSRPMNRDVPRSGELMVSLAAKGKGVQLGGLKAMVFSSAGIMAGLSPCCVLAEPMRAARTERYMRGLTPNAPPASIPIAGMVFRAA